MIPLERRTATGRDARDAHDARAPSHPIVMAMLELYGGTTRNFRDRRFDLYRVVWNDGRKRPLKW